MILMEKKLLEHSTKKNYKKQIKMNLEFKNESQEKVINYMVSGKDDIIPLIGG